MRGQKRGLLCRILGGCYMVHHRFDRSDMHCARCGRVPEAK